MWYLSPDIAEMNIGQPVQRSKTVNRLIDIPVSHLLNTSHTELKTIRGTFVNRDHFLIILRFIDQPGMSPQLWHRRIIRMCCHAHPVLLCHRRDLIDKICPSIPQLLFRYRTDEALWCFRIIGHIPYLSMRDRHIFPSVLPVKAGGIRSPSCRPSSGMPPHSGYAEIVAKDRDP